MKHLKLLALFAMTAFLWSCETPQNPVPEGERPGPSVSVGLGGGSAAGSADINTVITVGVNIETDNGDDLNDCQITTLSGEAVISDTNGSTETLSTRQTQTFFVNDESDNVIMMSRRQGNNQTNVTINSISTAIAMVTLHPLFAPLKGEEYDELVRMIENSRYFPDLLMQVENAIYYKNDIFDVNNQELMVNLSNLLEDLCLDLSEGDYEGSLDTRHLREAGHFKRFAIYENPRVYPLYAEINQNILTLRNTGLTPSYFGTVTRLQDGHEDNIAVKARDDYGGFDLFKTESEILYGPEFNYYFSYAGEYDFYLSRTSEVAMADFALRLANSILSAMGIEVDDIAQEVGNTICRALINAGSGVNDAVIDPVAWLEIGYKKALEMIAAEEAFSNIQHIGSFFLKSLNYYNKIKGTANSMIRIAYAITAPTELNFCLCYYNNEVSTCSTAVLEKGTGDEQNGYYGQRLLEPLTVYVNAVDEDGNAVQPGNYYRVKFEVTSGGGSVENEYQAVDHNYQASTYWTLGEEGYQEVKAVIVDMITDKEISNPVYFTAGVSSVDVTIRLDWHKLSGNTDIDLHVVDPFGERIWYSHMTSESGGWLDRDDVIGPGPEHIRWESAPAGRYEIYVHFYGPNVPDVTTYTVTATILGRTYQPVSGSISFDQMVPIGTFTITDGEVGYNNQPETRMSYPSLGSLDSVLRQWERVPKN